MKLIEEYSGGISHPWRGWFLVRQRYYDGLRERTRGLLVDANEVVAVGEVERDYSEEDDHSEASLLYLRGQKEPVWVEETIRQVLALIQKARGVSSD